MKELIKKFTEKNIAEEDAIMLISEVEKWKKRSKKSPVPKIKITVNYDTGDSFSIYDETEELDYSWKDLNIVRENIEALEEHYKYYEDLNKWCRLSNKEIEDKHKVAENKWWYVKDIRADKFMSFHSLYLKLDDGSLFQYSTPWTDFFTSTVSFTVKL